MYFPYLKSRFMLTLLTTRPSRLHTGKTFPPPPVCWIPCLLFSQNISGFPHLLVLYSAFSSFPLALILSQRVTQVSKINESEAPPLATTLVFHVEPASSFWFQLPASEDLGESSSSSSVCIPAIQGGEIHWVLSSQLWSPPTLTCCVHSASKPVSQGELCISHCLWSSNKS